ncbi:phage tail assembly chaperone [Citrobacter meridianamericanus]|uniref:phage tail assembly chaperone n=1 Tax=Citrobacter meridianamericanus TaxID=2894201 RepID=UPI0039BDFB7D
MDDSIKHVEINGKKYCIIRMSAFDAVHFNLRVAEILAKHGISQVESILSMSSKIFGMLNREDHDELLFTLLSKSRAQLVDNGEFLDSWDAVNTNFTAANIADVYLVALECLKLSILPVTAGLKKNIGLDTAATMQGAMRQLFNALLKTLTEPSAQNSSSGE